MILLSLSFLILLNYAILIGFYFKLNKVNKLNKEIKDLEDVFGKASSLIYELVRLHGIMAEKQKTFAAVGEDYLKFKKDFGEFQMIMAEFVVLTEDFMAKSAPQVRRETRSIDNLFSKKPDKKVKPN